MNPVEPDSPDEIVAAEEKRHRPHDQQNHDDRGGGESGQHDRDQDGGTDGRDEEPGERQKCRVSLRGLSAATLRKFWTRQRGAVVFHQAISPFSIRRRSSCSRWMKPSSSPSRIVDSFTRNPSIPPGGSKVTRSII